MKKKLEADLISIAHRILKLKNRAELDQLQQETLKLYEKISVLRFVEDHFGGAEPTIGRASAVFELEEIYNIEHVDAVKANEQEAIEDEARAKKAEDAKAKKEEDKIAESAEAKENESEETAPVNAEEESEVAGDAEPEAEEAKDSEEETPEAENGEEEVSDEEKELTEESDEEVKEEVKQEETKTEAVEETESTESSEEEAEEETETAEEKAPADEKEEAEASEAEQQPEETPATEEPEIKVEVNKPAETVETEEQSAAAVFEKESDTTVEEVAFAVDAEVKTIEPDATSKPAPTTLDPDLFERKAAPEEPVKQKEITFEDYVDYKEPEFVKKDSLDTHISTPVPPEVKQEIEPLTQNANAVDDWQNSTPVPPEVKEEILEENDWRNWEPKKAEETEKPKPLFDWEATIQPKKEEPVVDDWQNWEPKKEAEPEKPAEPEFKLDVPEPAQPKQGFSWDEPKPEPVREEPKPAPAKPEGLGKAINLALNDRIAFEKHLFAGSGDDLNRVISQLNTLNTYREAQNFIEDLVKPDYNNWTGKEEYEERFMALVEKRFS